MLWVRSHLLLCHMPRSKAAPTPAGAISTWVSRRVSDEGPTPPDVPLEFDSIPPRTPLRSLSPHDNVSSTVSLPKNLHALVWSWNDGAGV